MGLRHGHEEGVRDVMSVVLRGAAWCCSVMAPCDNNECGVRGCAVRFQHLVDTCIGGAGYASGLVTNHCTAGEPLLPVLLLGRRTLTPLVGYWYPRPLTPRPPDFLVPPVDA